MYKFTMLDFLTAGTDEEAAEIWEQIIGEPEYVEPPRIDNN